MKTEKIMEVHECGVWLVANYEEGPDPYRLYEIWWNQGRHRRLIAKYRKFASLMQHVSAYITGGPAAWEDRDV